MFHNILNWLSKSFLIYHLYIILKIQEFFESIDSSKKKQHCCKYNLCYLFFTNLLSSNEYDFHSNWKQNGFSNFFKDFKVIWTLQKWSNLLKCDYIYRFKDVSHSFVNTIFVIHNLTAKKCRTFLNVEYSKTSRTLPLPEY